MKYGRINNVPVVLLDRATKIARKTGEVKKNQIVVQSLITGDTAIVNKSRIKGITTRFPKLKERN